MTPRTVLTRSIHLEAKLDAVLFARPDDEEGKTIAGKAAAAGAAGAAAYGGYRADKSIMAKYGQRGLLDQGASGPLGSHNMAPRAAAGTGVLTRGQAYTAAAKDTGQAILNRGSAGLRAGRHAASVLREDGAGLIGSTLGGIRKGGKVALAPVLQSGRLARQDALRKLRLLGEKLAKK